MRPKLTNETLVHSTPKSRLSMEYPQASGGCAYVTALSHP